MVVSTNSADLTIALGRKFYSFLEEKDVVVFQGALGGGKTTFIKGILLASGYRGEVLSPSFTLVKAYKKGRITFYHADLYRINSDDIFATGLQDYIYSNGSITFIEWGEKIINQLPTYINLNFSYKGETGRHIKISSKGLLNKRLKRLNSVFLK